MLGGQHRQRVGFTDDERTADGVLARTDGTVTQPDSSGSEHCIGTSDTGCYDHTIPANHGYLTRDSRNRCTGTWYDSDLTDGGSSRS